MRFSWLLLVLAFVVSCSGINSELDTAYIENPEINEKPKCQFKPTNNCWTQSMALLMGCIDAPVPNDVDVLTDDKRFCSNKSGKLIEFVNPLALVEKRSIEFKVYNTKTKCFSFKGTSQSFVIDQSEYGRLSVRKNNSGNIEVQCFFGESFEIPAEAVEKGCQGEALKVGDYLPKASLFSFQDGEDSGYQFIFQGLSGQPQALFKCYE